MAEDSIGNRAARGAMWNIIGSVGSRVVGLIGTLYMTRLLAPEVIGEVSAAAVLALSVNWFTHIGFNQYMLTEGRKSSERTYHVAVLNVVLPAIGMLLVAFTGRWFAPIFSAPNLALYLPGMALTMFIRRIGGTADKILLRELRFREVALATAAGELIYTVLAVALAAKTQLGGQAIVVANVVQSIVTTTLVLRATGVGWFERAPWSWARVKEILGYGLPIGVSSVLQGASRYWDNLMFGAFFGRGVLGVYNMAYNLADVPAVQFGEQIAGVLLPAMQKVEPHERRRAVVHASALLALVVFPMAVGLGVIAQSLIMVLLKPTWYGVAPLLTVLAALSVFRPLTWVLSSYLMTFGRNRVLMVLEGVKLVLLLGLIAALSRLGPVWSAGAVGVAFAIHALMMSVLVVREDGISGRALASGFIRPVIACLFMSAAVLGTRHFMLTHGVTHRFLVLFAEIAVGGLVYVAAALVVARETSLEFIQRIRKALIKRA